MFCLTGTYACIAAGGAGSDPVDPDPVDTGTGTGTGCPTCGTIMKTGQRSCCAPGGSWFNNCGGAGNSNFDHTWVEGISACRGAATLLLKETHSHTIADVVPDVAAVDSKECTELSTRTSLICLSFIMLYSQM